MTDLDVQWFKRCHASGLVKNKMLEIGSAKVQGIPNLCEIARQLGVKNTLGVDIGKAAGVDEVFDFGVSVANFQKTWSLGVFSTVSIFNVLEHTYDPITVLKNALACVEDGGTLLVVTPAIWPIHNYPFDYNRLLPDWYREFSKSNDLRLIDNEFCWLSAFGIECIKSAAALPNFMTTSLGVSRYRYWASRIGHKILNTYGRSHSLTHSAIGAAFVRS